MRLIPQAAVKESGIAGETACATTSTAVFPKVGQAVSPADFLGRPFLYSFLLAVSLLGVSGLAFAGLVYAGGEPTVTVSALKALEDTANRQFLHDAADPIDPWEPLGDARGTYLPGYGAIFTFEMSLVNVTPITPFHASISAQEIKSIHARKIKKLPLVKSAMQDLIVKSATTLSAMPPTEQITVEAFLDYFSFEDRTNLPRRLIMTASRQKILDAMARHAAPAEFATLIEEREEQ